jgi:hypothetical protein
LGIDAAVTQFLFRKGDRERAQRIANDKAAAGLGSLPAAMKSIGAAKSREAAARRAAQVAASAKRFMRLEPMPARLMGS